MMPAFTIFDVQPESILTHYMYPLYVFSFSVLCSAITVGLLGLKLLLAYVCKSFPVFVKSLSVLVFSFKYFTYMFVVLYTHVSVMEVFINKYK